MTIRRVGLATVLGLAALPLAGCYVGPAYAPRPAPVYVQRPPPPIYVRPPPPVVVVPRPYGY